MCKHKDQQIFPSTVYMILFSPLKLLLSRNWGKVTFWGAKREMQAVHYSLLLCLLGLQLLADGATVVCGRRLSYDTGSLGSRILKTVEEGGCRPILCLPLCLVTMEASQRTQWPT